MLAVLALDVHSGRPVILLLPDSIINPLALLFTAFSPRLRPLLFPLLLVIHATYEKLAAYRTCQWHVKESLPARGATLLVFLRL